MSRPRLSGLALVALTGAAGCIDSGPPVWAPAPAATGGTSEACVRARAFVARGPALVAEGKLDRAVRALTRAEELCPAEAPSTWALRVKALAELGRTTEAFQLAARVERSDRAGDAERAAAKEARAVAEERARAITEQGTRRDAPELFDPADKRRAKAVGLFHAGADASRAGDHPAAQRLFLDAWDAWHPDPRALVEAGLEALAQGRRAEAQALWDRAAFDDSTLAARPVIPSGAPPAVADRVIAWSPRGDRFAVSGDHAVDVFDVELHVRLRVKPRDTVTAIGFAADGGRLYLGLEGGAVQVFDALVGLPEHDLEWHKAAVRSIAATPDGRLVLTASDDGTVGTWDARAQTRAGFLAARRTGTQEAAALLALDAAGRTLAIADDDGQIVLYRLPDGAALGRLAAHGAVRAMAFGPTMPDTGLDLEVVTAGERVRWEITASTRSRSTTIARATTERASVRASSGRAIVAAIETADPAEVALSDMGGKDAARIADAAAHGGITAFALSPDGASLATVFKDRTLAILPLAQGDARAPRVLSPSAPVDAIAVAATSASVKAPMLVAASGGRVVVWRSASDRLHAHDVAGVRALALSPDGDTLAMGLEGSRVELRDLGARRPDVFFDTNGPVRTLGYAADGAHLVAGTDAPSVEILAAAAKEEPRALHVTGGVRAARFAPDGASVLVAANEGLVLWKPGSREGLRLAAYGAEVRDAAFTPDGSGFVVASQRGELMLGKASPPGPPQTVVVPSRALRVAVAKDGTIATAEGDRSIALRTAAGKQGHRFRDPDAQPRAITFLGPFVAAGLDDGSVRVYRAPDTGPAAILEILPGLPPGKLAGVVRGPRGHLEIVGPDAAAARGAVRCVVGAVYYPIDVCAEQFVYEGLLPLALSGKDVAEAEP